MGKKSILSYFNKKQKKEQEELKHRADQFMAEYKVIRARYCCDFQGFLKQVDGGEGGIVPNIRIIDVTKAVEAEEAAEREKEKAEQLKKLTPEKQNGNQESKT